MEIFNSIEINAKGKSKKELKKEILKRVEDEIEKILDKKEEVKEEVEEKELHKFHILCDESEDKEGFGVAIESEGEPARLFGMLVCMTSSALRTLEEEYEGDRGILPTFIKCLIDEYTDNSAESVKKNG